MIVKGVGVFADVHCAYSALWDGSLELQCPWDTVAIRCPPTCLFLRRGGICAKGLAPSGPVVAPWLEAGSRDPLPPTSLHQEDGICAKGSAFCRTVL